MSQFRTRNAFAAARSAVREAAANVWAKTGVRNTVHLLLAWVAVAALFLVFGASRTTAFGGATLLFAGSLFGVVIRPYISMRTNTVTGFAGDQLVLRLDRLVGSTDTPEDQLNVAWEARQAAEDDLSRLRRRFSRLRRENARLTARNESLAQIIIDHVDAKYPEAADDGATTTSHSRHNGRSSLAIAGGY